MSVLVQQPAREQDLVPDQHLYSFPPFPRPPPNARPLAFRDFLPTGLVIKAGPSRLCQASSHLAKVDAVLRLVDVTSCTTESHPAGLKSGVPTHGLDPAYIINRDGLAILRPSAAWLIGDPLSQWQEPAASSVASYNLSIAPFDRLMSAARDFRASRFMSFDRHRNNFLYNVMRQAFGLYSDRDDSRLHWSGTTAEAEWEARSDADESCVLLIRPEIVVRGFLATARREAEAGWEFDPALQLARITAAFLAYVHHHDVLPDIAGYKDAVALAREGPGRLQVAKDLEDALCSPLSWNRAAWTMWGGEYGGPERGGREREIQQAVRGDFEQGDMSDGGWSVDPPPDHRPLAATKAQVRPHLARYLSPLDPDAVRMIQYLPFARRRISHILPYDPCHHSNLGLNTAMYRLVTVPAPWTPDEKWKARPRFAEEGTDDEAKDPYAPVIDPQVAAVFDAERASIDEPDELEILVEAVALDRKHLDTYVGIGLRGRWGLVQATSVEHGYWIFKAKDFVLPNFWQKAPVT